MPVANAPAARIYALMVLFFAHSPSGTPAEQPLDTIIFMAAMLAGESLGFFCNRALRNMYIAQVLRMEQLQREKERIAYDLQFTQHRLAQQPATRNSRAASLRSGGRPAGSRRSKKSPSRPARGVGGSNVSGLSSEASWDGLPSHVIDWLTRSGLLVENILQNDAFDGTPRWTAPAVAPPEQGLIGCGVSTVGSNSEIGNLLTR